jgi:hypothetical protein
MKLNLINRIEQNSTTANVKVNVYKFKRILATSYCVLFYESRGLAAKSCTVGHVCGACHQWFDNENFDRRRQKLAAAAARAQLCLVVVCVFIGL